MSSGPASVAISPARRLSFPGWSPRIVKTLSKFMGVPVRDVLKIGVDLEGLAHVPTQKGQLQIDPAGRRDVHGGDVDHDPP